MRKKAVEVSNQDVLIQAMASVLVPLHQQPQELVSLRGATLARGKRTQLRHVATVPAILGDKHEFVRGIGVYDWFLMDVEQDPLYQNGSLSIPLPVTDRLRDIERTGVQFDALWIAHEVPKGQFEPGHQLTSEDLAPERQAYKPQIKPVLNVLRMILGAFSKVGYGAGILSGMAVQQVQDEIDNRPTPPLKHLAAQVVEQVVQQRPATPAEPIKQNSGPDEYSLLLKQIEADRKQREEAERAAQVERLQTFSVNQQKQQQEEGQRKQVASLVQAERMAQEERKRQVQVQAEQERLAQVYAERAERKAREEKAEQERMAIWARDQEISKVVNGLRRWNWAVTMPEQNAIADLQARHGSRTITDHLGNLNVWLPGRGNPVIVQRGDPILFGVMIRNGISDLYYLGHW